MEKIKNLARGAVSILLLSILLMACGIKGKLTGGLNAKSGSGAVIKMVQDGRMESSPEYSIDEVFSNLFYDGKWNSYEVNSGTNMVNYTGKIKVLDEDIKVNFSVEDKKFEVSQVNIAGSKIEGEDAKFALDKIIGIYAGTKEDGKSDISESISKVVEEILASVTKESTSVEETAATATQETVAPETQVAQTVPATEEVETWGVKADDFQDYIMADQGDNLHIIDCDESISLRTAPDKSARVITQIPLYATVKYIEGAVNGFVRVEYNGQFGYALVAYMDTYEPQVATGQTMTVINAKQSVTLRTSPYTTAEEIMQIPVGAKVYYLEPKRDFYLVSYDGQAGYVLGSYLRFD